MDIHAEYLDIASLLRAVARADGAYGVDADSAGRLERVADAIDPNAYAEPAPEVSDPREGLTIAIEKVSAVQREFAPASAGPIREELGQVLAGLTQ